MKFFPFTAGIAVLLVGVAAFSQPAAPNAYRDFFDSEKFLRTPFQEGEKLAYEVNWKPLFAMPAFKAGEVTMSVEESRLSGLETYKITAWAVSTGTLANVAGFDVRNYFESYIDRRDYRSYRMFQKIRQGTKKRNLELTFDYENNQTIISETDESSSPPRSLRRKIAKGIPAPAADVLSVFYVGRVRSAQVGDRFQLYLNEKGDFKKVLVVAEKKETITTPVGDFPTLKLSTTGGLFKNGGEFRIWYSTDRLRVPVKFEADVKVGKVYGDLIRLESSRQTRSVIRVK